MMLGYRGTGKSVVSKVLSVELRMQLFRIDNMVVKAAGKPIAKIVEQDGWPAFRKLESEIVDRVSREVQNSIIDCGGGVILDDNNMVLLKQVGKCVLLTADLEVIIRRIHKDKNRPALESGLSFEEEQKKILAERKDKYESVADFICDTSTRKPEESAQTIITHFRKLGWLK
jgi:shikimate kinase